ncbi:MAG: NYN domain-containing protein [Hydrogenophaga sp.]|nr:NYN domain-containing protein [Hydrogenophaga sp.]
MQQAHYSNGKNATDSALIMDAMEPLRERDRWVDVFCIVSPDNDCTGSVGRTREAGRTIYDFGRHDAAPSFIAACNAFVCLDLAEVRAAV